MPMGVYPSYMPSGIHTFWHRVELGFESGCWVWAGHLTKGGYGQLSHYGREAYAHRFAYELLVGPIPDGLQIDHLCRNRACVNPDHMEPVTSGENSRRSPLIGRHPNSRGNARKRPA